MANLAAIVWSAIGLGISVLLAVVAATRLGARAGHFDGAVYGMRPALHARYATLGAAFALAFLASLFWSALPVVPLLAAVVLIALLYFTSFLRGAEADE